LPCQGWVVEVMMLFKQLANDHTPTGHGAPQAILQMGIMLGGQELRAHRQAKRLRGRLLYLSWWAYTGTLPTLRRSSNDPHSRLEMAAVGPLSRIATRPRLRPRRSSSEATAHAYQPPADGLSRRCSFGPVLVNQVGVVLRHRLHTPVALGGCVDPHRLQPIQRPVGGR
jgi:hypothetical protein